MRKHGIRVDEARTHLYNAMLTFWKRWLSSRGYSVGPTRPPGFTAQRSRVASRAADGD
jgi:hypothetical protein